MSLWTRLRRNAKPRQDTPVPTAPEAARYPQWTQLLGNDRLDYQPRHGWPVGQTEVLPALDVNGRPAWTPAQEWRAGHSRERFCDG